MKYELARSYIVMDVEGVPPFVYAEFVECAIETDPEIAPGVKWSGLTTNAEATNNTGGAVFTRPQLEAEPRLRQALERWEAGDDTPAAEYDRRNLIESASVPLADEGAEARARDAIIHGPIAIPA